MAKSDNTLKISLLFAKYLYQNRQLNLPGIGVFSIDPSVTIPDLTEKNSHEFLHHIKFSQKPVAKPDDAFIDFIRTNTGKIRPLAESDLESFISEGKILLNIGKPFHLEGIGSLQKNKSSTYDFYPGLPLTEKLDNFLMDKDPKPVASRQPYEQDYNPATSNSQTGKTIWIIFAILVGLTAIIWGGYTLYNNNTDNEGSQSANSTAVEPASQLADTTQANTTDTATVIAPAQQITAPTTAQTYKFIFRLGSRNYVINRFNDLKPSTPALNWDTKDSVVYRLFLSLPAAPSDTARIRDSLKSWYGSKRVLIEK